MDKVIAAKHKKEEAIQMTLGASAVALTAPTDNRAPDNILVQAHPSNSGIITIAFEITPANGGAGYALPAGANISLGSIDWTKYKAIATAASQKLNITYQYGAE